MATQLVVPTETSCTLYELEDNLQALANSVELAEDPSDRAAILEEIGQALRKTAEKRDAVVAFLRHCQSQLSFADAEVERIEKRKARIARIQEELESYCARIVEQYATPDRKGIRRLEGRFSSLRIQKNPESVLVTDVEALPSAFKQATVTMPAYIWKALLGNLEADWRQMLEQHVAKLEFKPDKKSLAIELKSGTQIPGADLKFGEWRLVIG
jgi:hypothetical protein